MKYGLSLRFFFLFKNIEGCSNFSAIGKIILRWLAGIPV